MGRNPYCIRILLESSIHGSVLGHGTVPQYMTGDQMPVERVQGMVKQGTGLIHGTGIPWILRAIMSIHEIGHIPGILI
jgi:hypothetical protein